MAPKTIWRALALQIWWLQGTMVNMSACGCSHRQILQSTMITGRAPWQQNKLLMDRYDRE